MNSSFIRSVTSAEPDNVTQFREFYQSLDDSALQQNFQDLDDPVVLEAGLHAVLNSSTTNYVLDIAEDTAWVAFDLAAPSLGKLMDAGRPEGMNARWINIFYPDCNRPILEGIAKRYDFSPRLLAMMLSDSRQPKVSLSSASALRSLRSTRKPTWRRSAPSRDSGPEVEKGLGEEMSEHSSISTHSSLAYGNIYRMADDLWHYTSVDFGRSYVCLGYNSLYGTKRAGADETPDVGLLPQVTRVWTWLIICEDSTVISINEDPFPLNGGRWDELQNRISVEVRRNLYNVFRALSAADPIEMETQNPMTLLPIRQRLGSTLEETAHREADTPGLLFYYLFENWHNSYTLITRRESRYGVELAQLRDEMFTAPRLHHIDRLDRIAKELGVLKRHFHGYNRMIERLLEPQGATAASLQNSRLVIDGRSRTSLDTVRPVAVITEQESMLGVSISSAARVRFKRLKDLIDLYALSEVEEYLKQKESLVAMVKFHLLSDDHQLMASPELQSPGDERVSRRREADPHQSLPDQGYVSLSAGLTGDDLFRHPARRPFVHRGRLLDRCQRGSRAELHGVDVIWALDR